MSSVHPAFCKVHQNVKDSSRRRTLCSVAGCLRVAALGKYRKTGKCLWHAAPCKRCEVPACPRLKRSSSKLCGTHCHQITATSEAVSPSEKESESGGSSSEPPSCASSESEDAASSCSSSSELQSTTQLRTKLLLMWQELEPANRNYKVWKVKVFQLAFVKDVD